MEYDKIHNITVKRQEVRDAVSGVMMPLPQYSQNNAYEYGTQPHAVKRITKQDDPGYVFRENTHDSDGNLTMIRHHNNAWARTLEWDEENRLTTVRNHAPVPGSGGIYEQYRYDHKGERRIKFMTGHELVVYPVTMYINQFAACSVNSANERERLMKHIFAGNQRVASKVIVDPDEATPVEFTFFYHTDHLGSTTYMTDADAAVVEYVEYMPWGESWMEDGSKLPKDGYRTVSTPFRFTSKERDRTGFYYFGARYYDPITAVWLSPDPILAAYIDGRVNDGIYNSHNLALYAYSYQNPVKYIDVDGNFVAGTATFSVLKGDMSTFRILSNYNQQMLKTSETIGSTGLSFVGLGTTGSGIKMGVNIISRGVSMKSPGTIIAGLSIFSGNVASFGKQAHDLLGGTSSLEMDVAFSGIDTITGGISLLAPGDISGKLLGAGSITKSMYDMQSIKFPSGGTAGAGPQPQSFSEIIQQNLFPEYYEAAQKEMPPYNPNQILWMGK
ncbi:MAG TPA: hypothetical protein ENN43_01350 [bacterium]|nr:hypothetical protein [bacterium]